MSSQFDKTVFITITRGLLMRNFIRTAFFNEMEKQNTVRFVICIPIGPDISVPEYLKNEVERKNIIIELMSNKTIHGFERLFNNFLTRLVFTNSTNIVMKYHISKKRRLPAWRLLIMRLFYGSVKDIPGMKQFMRYLYIVLFRKKYYDSYFDTYMPDVVFSTSIASQFDVQLLKEALGRKIHTVTMPKSWDNLHKQLFRVVSDSILVQNEKMKETVVSLQKISKDRVHVVGFPQFDMYNDDTIIKSRENYCKGKNFDVTKPILFFGSEGDWSVGDDTVVEQLISARAEGVIPYCNILVRPHFSHIKRHPFKRFDKVTHLYLDDVYRTSEFFHDGWDPTVEDMHDFTNTLFHSDMLITFASTLALDGVCFDKPIIAIQYGVRFIEGVDRSDLLYATDHYAWVLDTNAVSITKSKDELLKNINYYLRFPEHKNHERNILRKSLCGPLDGHSSTRIMKEILNS